MTQFYYTCNIYEKIGSITNSKVYDVEVFAGTKFFVWPTPSDTRVCINTIINTCSDNISLGKLTKYMHWKFRCCQCVYDNKRPVCSRGKFTNLTNSLGWILSIVRVELDFHTGKKMCDDSWMQKYRESQYSGFGPIHSYDHRPLING